MSGPADHLPHVPQTEALGSSGLPHALVQQFQMQVIEGPDAGALFVSSGARAVIGTHESADLVLHDVTVSRFHCEIRITENAALVRDLGSKNGTRVSGVKVFSCELESGAVLTLGRTRIEFNLGSERVKIALAGRTRFGSLVGRSPSMRAVFAVLERAAKSEATVLIEGETGTGKDAAAESIHLESARKSGPFVVVDCGALPAGVLESELFGHERGAFTGADRPRRGALEASSGGTLFIDEIGELSADLQPKLLRALERRDIQRIGSNERVPIDVRVVAATNRNLRTEVNAGRFRADLYFRLAVIEVALPSLRERLDDLEPLVDDLLERMGAVGAAADSLRTAATLTELARHSWPGNVRELRNYLERCLVFEEMLPLPEVTQGASEVDLSQPLRVARERCVRAFERRYLEALLRRHDDNVVAAARAAGVDRVHLHRLLARVGLR